MEWFVDSARGRWLQERIPQLGMMVPSGMPAYARILHPVLAFREDGSGRPWRWEEVAARNNVVMDGTSEWWDITPDGADHQRLDRWIVSKPSDGQIDPDLLASLVPALAVHTSCPDDITVGVWEGWGFGGSIGSSAVLHVTTWEDDDTAGEPVRDLVAARRAATDPGLIEMDEFAGSAFGGVRSGTRGFGVRPAFPRAA